MPRAKRSFAWLRVVLLNLALVIAGVGGYFLYFKNDRESSLTDSYMRSLDRVAERIELFSQNGRQIGSFLTCTGAGSGGESIGLADACESARAALTSSPGFERITLVFEVPETAASEGRCEAAGDHAAGEPEARRQPVAAEKGAFVPLTVGEHGSEVFESFDVLHVVRPAVLGNSRVLYMPTGSARTPARDRCDVRAGVRNAILIGVAVPVEDALAVPAATFPFDALYLVKADGGVIAQRELPDGPPQAHPVELIVPATERRSFTRLADLAQAMEATERSLSDADESDRQRSTPAVTSLSASQVSRISLGDRLFRVFIQPIDRLVLREPVTDDAARARAEQSGGTIAGGGSSTLAVVGIVDEHRFQRTALSVGYTPLAVLLGISILLIASLPLLRLFLTDRHMTISRGFAWTVVAGSALTLLITMFVVVLWGQQRWQSHTLRAQVREATEQVLVRVQEELDRLGTLTVLYRNSFRGRYPPAAGADDRLRQAYESRRCRAIDKRAHVLAPDEPSLAPFALALAPDGREIIEYRASCRGTDPAVLNVPDRAYFKYWRNPPPDPADFYFQRLISYLDGSRSFIVSTAWQPDRRARVACRSSGRCPDVAVLVSDMQELAMASATRRQPTGMRFALVTQGGEVVYHSFDELSVVENWLRETDSPTGLVGALQIRKPVSFHAQYHGAPIIGYVTPLRLGEQRTYAPRMWLIGYVPTADLDALRFYSAMMGLPVLLMVAAGWTVIFVIATALPGRRYDMVFPNARRAPAYRRVLLGAAAGSVVWVAGAWVAAGSGLVLLEQAPDLLLLGLIAQLGWLCSRPNELFAPGAGRGRAVIVYAGGAIAIALALGVALGVLVPGIDTWTDLFLLVLQVVTLGGGWVPLVVLPGTRRSRAEAAASIRWPVGVARAYLGMWLALLAMLVLHTMGSYLVLTRHWQETTEGQYQSTFCRLVGELVHQNVDAQLSRLPEHERSDNAWARHLRGRLAERAEPPCVAVPFTNAGEAAGQTPATGGNAGSAEPLRWFSRLEASLPSINASVGAARTRVESAAPILVTDIGETLAAVVVLSGVLLGMFLTLRAVARRLFGLNVVFATHLAEAPFSVRASEDSRAVLYVESLRDTRVYIEPAEAGWQCRTFRSVAELEGVTLQNDTLLILEGFEADVIDAERRARLIGHLQRLVQTAQPVLVIAPVLPGYWLTRHEDLMRAGESLSIEDATEWHALLERFTVVTGCPSHPRAAVYVPYDLRAHREHLQRLEAAGIDQAVRNFVVSEIERCPRIRHFVAPLCHELLHRIRQGHIAGASVDQTLVVQVLARALEGEFQRFWSMSSPDEQAELISIAQGGYPNFADIQTIQSLMQRGLLVKVAGRICLPCETFRQFVLTRSQYRLKALQARRSREGLWGAVLPSLMVVVGLILAFVVASSSRGADLVLAAMAGLVALVPALNALVSLTSRRSGGSSRSEEG